MRDRIKATERLSKTIYGQLFTLCLNESIKTEAIIDTNVKFISGSILCFCFSILEKKSTMHIVRPPKQTIGITNAAKIFTMKISIRPNNILLYASVLID